ncbi:DsbA family oxidoreductase [Candidatus Izimaplasma bacterium ZiA1]|uniref:DsbA family oxidoreductase n=1 Tax=Candidatus Izimoplasma sp. ZiA1 TaxID=2024899 RepID=UPI001F0AA1BF
MIKIEVWSDFACPFCYIGKKRFDAALSKFEHKDQVEVSFKAYQLNPNAPKLMTESAEATFAKGHRITVEQAKQKFDMFVTNAKTVGLDYNYDIIQMTNSFDAHRVAKWARQFGKEEEVTNRFMKAYFTDGLNIADHETLIKLTKELDINTTDLDNILVSDAYKDIVNSEITEAREVGVRGVPFFVLNRKYGVSGAQPEEYFTEVLNTLWKEEKEVKPLKSTVKGHTCDDEGCSI